VSSYEIDVLLGRLEGDNKKKIPMLVEKGTGTSVMVQYSLSMKTVVKNFIAPSPTLLKVKSISIQLNPEPLVSIVHMVHVIVVRDLDSP
jgi:hypothetical protein